VLIGALLALMSLGLLAAGGVALWADTTQRHGGDIDLGTWSYRSTGYAVASTTANPYGATGGLPAMGSLLGTVRIRATSAAGAGPVFVGIAPADAAGRYLAGVAYDTVRGTASYHAIYAGHGGGVGQVSGRGCFQEGLRQADSHAQAARIHRRIDQRPGGGQCVAVTGQQLGCPGQELDNLPVLRGRSSLGQPCVLCLAEPPQLVRGERSRHGDIPAG
jgi:hypothetical protein